MADAQDRAAAQPIVAVVADSATVEALDRGARRGWSPATSEQSFPMLRIVAPAENVAVQARALLADEDARLFGGAERHARAAGADRPEQGRARSSAAGCSCLVDEARRTAALEGRGRRSAAVSSSSGVVTEQAAGNLQMIRRGVARGGQGLIFTVTLMLATLLLSTLVEEKSNKMIEVLAAAVPLDAVFLGKLIAMLGISLVGLALWGGMIALGYAFFLQMFAGLDHAAAGRAGGRLADLGSCCCCSITPPISCCSARCSSASARRRATSARSRPSRCRSPCSS